MNNTSQYSDLDGMIRSMQREDMRNLRIARNFQIIMWFFVFLYFLMFLVNPDPYFSLLNRLGGFFYVLAFLLFALIFRQLHLEYKYVDYSLHVLEMLRQAVKRYSLFQRKVLMVIIPILLIDAGMVLLTYNPEHGEVLQERILWANSILIPALSIGMLIGYTIWRKRQKPLRDSALSMLHDFES